MLIGLYVDENKKSPHSLKYKLHILSLTKRRKSSIVPASCFDDYTNFVGLNCGGYEI